MPTALLGKGFVVKINFFLTSVFCIGCHFGAPTAPVFISNVAGHLQLVDASGTQSRYCGAEHIGATSAQLMESNIFRWAAQFQAAERL